MKLFLKSKRRGPNKLELLAKFEAHKIKAERLQMQPWHLQKGNVAAMHPQSWLRFTRV